MFHARSVWLLLSVVLNTLKLLSRKTSIMSTPERLEDEAMKAVMQPFYTQSDIDTSKDGAAASWCIAEHCLPLPAVSEELYWAMPLKLSWQTLVMRNCRLTVAVTFAIWEVTSLRWRLQTEGQGQPNCQWSESLRRVQTEYCWHAMSLCDIHLHTA